MQPRSYAIFVKITAKRQVTLPAHVLDEMAVAQATGFNSYQASRDTFSGSGALTSRAWELYGRRFRGAIRPSTSAHSVIIPTIQIYETDWRAARAGANIEALSPVAAESVVSHQFREIRRH